MRVLLLREANPQVRRQAVALLAHDDTGALNHPHAPAVVEVGSGAVPVAVLATFHTAMAVLGCFDANVGFYQAPCCHVNTSAFSLVALASAWI